MRFVDTDAVPSEISQARFNMAMRALGLPMSALDRLMRVELEPGRVTATFMRVGDRGPIVVGEGDDRRVGVLTVDIEVRS